MPASLAAKGLRLATACLLPSFRALPCARLLSAPPLLLRPLSTAAAPSSSSSDPALPKKQRERVTVTLNEADLVETFVKGSGPGGQCVNKRSNCVDLKHLPTGFRVQCQQTRSLDRNRAIARKILLGKLDDHINGRLSLSAIKGAKVAKQKAKRAKRAREKYGNTKAKGADVDKNGDGDVDADQDNNEDVTVPGEDRLIEEEMFEEIGVVKREEEEQKMGKANWNARR